MRRNWFLFFVSGSQKWEKNYTPNKCRIRATTQDSICLNDAWKLHNKTSRVLFSRAVLSIKGYLLPSRFVYRQIDGGCGIKIR